MIQRIQSIYLLLAGLVILALFLFPLAHGVYINGVPSTISVRGVFQDVNRQLALTQAFTALMIGTAVVGVLPIILIFQFKNRKRQVMLCYLYIVLIIGFTFWVVQTVKSVTGDLTLTTSNFGIGALLSSVSIVLVLVAVKGIQRDEKLIKSADRLR